MRLSKINASKHKTLGNNITLLISKSALIEISSITFKKKQKKCAYLR